MIQEEGKEDLNYPVNDVNVEHCLREKVLHIGICYKKNWTTKTPVKVISNSKSDYVKLFSLN